ncbi:hypothetical protein FH972_017962 [Carpinus fangiana]|uniref:LOB domain-containing protein n=1 Tax=Carpinus fangiana TaxID=176857 RepID=A0A5N6RL13_9ROSI|nr:hypothetical protein FH972_017962 [Carpinus fangiana]
MNSRAGNHNSPTGSQACAACKYQRRRCAPDCPLAPYFPPHHQKDFLNAHKLFGVSNILKIIKNLSPTDKPIAMGSIIFEANARANDPVGGSYRILSTLHRQIAHYKAERDLVLQQLAICRATLANPAALTTHAAQNIGLDPLAMYGLSHFPTEEQEQCGVVPDAYQDYSNVHPVHSINKEASTSSSLSEDIKPLLVFDEKEAAGFDAKDSVQCSDMKDLDSVQQDQDQQDLKGAASLFSLTNLEG